jgi:type I restriction-modification system DNA methylase subunit
MPSFNAAMRLQLIRACEFSWEKISPAIFGSLFQSILRKEERRKQGAHYTTDRNILKVIEPLFLDELREEFERLKARRDSNRANALLDFQRKLACLRFLDPACGCGNFLVIAYREVRELEIQVLKERFSLGQYELLDVATLSLIDVDQFYGIEINVSGARISEVALWMMDHIMNNRLSAAFGKAFARIPLQKSPHIHCADALEIDWGDILPPEQCSYILGNPPFIGAKFQSEKQRSQTRRIADLGGSGGTLDYVSAWFIVAGDYLERSKAKIGFVATNSITQGEQVAQLWPQLFQKYKLEIAFGHRTFAWQSEAKGKANVHCVIVGLTRREDVPAQKRLFSTPTSTQTRSRVSTPR